MEIGNLRRVPSVAVLVVSKRIPFETTLQVGEDYSPSRNEAVAGMMSVSSNNVIHSVQSSANYVDTSAADCSLCFCGSTHMLHLNGACGI